MAPLNSNDGDVLVGVGHLRYAQQLGVQIDHLGGLLGGAALTQAVREFNERAHRW